MYLECVSCPKLGVSCDGPNFVAMPARELLEWCKLRKSHLKMSNAKLAELSEMPKGTIDRLFAGEHMDFKFETIRPMIKALVGGAWGANPCADPQGQMDGRLEEKVKQLEEDKRKLKERMKETMDTYQKELDFLKEQVKYEQEVAKGRKKAIVTLGICLGVTMSLIIAALIIDRLNPNIGFFWIDRMFAPTGFSFTDFLGSL